MTAPEIIPTAEPFYLPGNRVGCILTHGFTGTPKEMRWLGDYLNQQGYSVLAPRLSGHATDPEDMARSRWWEWRNSLADAYYLLRPNVDSLFLIGLSMGGVLSLLTAAEKPDLQGIVTISTPYEMPIEDWRLSVIRPVAFFMPKIAKGEADWQNLQAAEDHVDYPYIPTHAVAELKDLLAEMQSKIHLVHEPALIVQSKKDQSVAYKHAQMVFDHISSQDKEVFLVENSGHVVIREPDRFQVFEKIDQFIKSHS